MKGRKWEWRISLLQQKAKNVAEDGGSRASARAFFCASGRPLREKFAEHSSPQSLLHPDLKSWEKRFEYIHTSTYVETWIFMEYVQSAADQVFPDSSLPAMFAHLVRAQRMRSLTCPFTALIATVVPVVETFGPCNSSDAGFSFSARRTVSPTSD